MTAGEREAFPTLTVRDRYRLRGLIKSHTHADGSVHLTQDEWLGLAGMELEYVKWLVGVPLVIDGLHTSKLRDRIVQQVHGDRTWSSDIVLDEEGLAWREDVLR